ncbi:unnamed protein product [Allacma fusca]|uniref:Ionotropic glutamate receptor C-terminal domain-containing protein n=1 Tax=Allacma fusca TaxID=39272 RepID=A0A8J2L7M1_9HEXA|nr:unnamed protein product [Allacma fusca]
MGSMELANFLDSFENCTINLISFRNSSDSSVDLQMKDFHPSWIENWSRSSRVSWINTRADNASLLYSVTSWDIHTGAPIRNIFAAQVPRFGGQCFVHLYIPEIQNSSLNTKRLYSSVKFFLEGTKENPTYVIIWTQETNKTNLEDFPNFFRNISWASTTAIYFSLAENEGGAKIQLIKISEPEDKNAVRLHDINIFDRRHYFQEWWRHHKNLERTIVKDFSYFQTKKPEDCSIYTAGMDTLPVACSMAVIETQLNFTFIRDREENFWNLKIHRFPSYVVGKFFADFWLVRRVRNNDENIVFEWLCPAMTFEKMTLLAVFDLNAHKISSLWGEFDWTTWLGILVSILCMSVVFHILILKPKKTNSIVRTIYSSLEFTSAFVIEMTVAHVADEKRFVKKNLRVMFFHLVVLWSGVSLVLSNAYKGALFSFLAATTAPPIPQNLEELVRGNYFLATTSHYVKGSAGEPLSLLYYALNETLQYGIMNEKRKDVLQELESKTVFIKSGLSVIASSHVEQNKGQLPQRGLSSFPNTLLGESSKVNNSVILPLNYVLIGEEEEIHLFQFMMQSLKDSRRFVGKGPTIDLFVKRTPVYVQRNFLYPVFNWNLYQIFESGLWERWLFYHEIHTANLELKTFRSQMNFKKRGLNLLDMLFRGQRMLESAANKDNEEKSLSLNVLQTVFFLLFIGICTSVVIFTAEWFRDRKRQDIIFVRRFAPNGLNNYS